MLDVVKVASYISCRYEQTFGVRIDEMKLHKLLYFVQRESLIQTDEPLFSTPFQAWKNGPVLVQIRSLYKSDMLTDYLSDLEVAQYLPIFDKVFEQYAAKDAWTLSSITHGEKSWIKAREGVSPDENSSALIDINDIRIDAHYIKLRRFYLSKLHSA